MNEQLIFESAVGKTTPQERAAFIKHACAGDQELFARVASLLEAHEHPDEFLDGPLVQPMATCSSAGPVEGPGSVIGPYKLLEQIGEGGFGVVFMAEQQQPLRRRVALKVIKPGMDTRQVIARFEAERQALALMDHPNIARVLDAGATDSGHPYFVMELVRGVPITELCDRNQLMPRERLELFVPVCKAVQHAHQKGIIHRDIKPSNVLVTLHDGVPVIKIIDFGIAKATGQQLTEKTLFTSFAQMIGTPLYMSPEQAEMSGLDVDTRSDIYSLGVLLYELLTGTTPFDKERLKTAGYDEIRRIIRDEDPPRPSARISTLGEALATVSANRQSNLKKLSQLCRGDLDWIAMKALEKDRARRYETASDLARDVQRYLHDEPVEACPPSAMYRFRKFARRNKAALTTAATVAFALLLGISISVWQAVLATQAAVRATEAEEWAEKGWDAEKTERQRAVAAERQAKERLFEAKVSQAEASQWSGRPGQRFASLAALAEAAQLIPALDLGPPAVLDLRNRAIVSLTRADLRPFPDGQQPQVPGWRIHKVDKDKITLQAYKKPRQEFQISVSGSSSRLSPCGLFLALSINREIQVWALEDRTLLCTIPRGPLAFSPDSAVLVACVSDGSLQIVDLPNGRETRSLLLASPHATQIAVGPGGRQAALVRKSEVAVVDLHTGATIAAHEFPGTIIGHLNWHPQGTLLAFTNNPPPVNKPPVSPKIVVWAPDSANEPLFLDGHSQVTSTLAFHANGLMLASAGGDGALRLWDPWTGKPLLSLQLATKALTFVPDKDVLEWRHPNTYPPKVGYLQTATGRECRTLAGHGLAALGGLDISSNERWLASSGSDGVRLWDLEVGKEIAFLKSRATVPSVAFDPYNGNLVTSAFVQTVRTVPGAYEHTRHELVSDGANSVKLVPLPLGPPVEVWRPRGPFLFVDPAEKRHFRGAISADGRWLLKGLSAGLVSELVTKPGRVAPPTLTDRDSGVVHELLPFHADTGPGQPDAQFALSPDGRRLVAASAKTYHFWQVEPLKHTGVLARQPGNVGLAAVAFSPDSRMAAVARSQMQISLVDPETLEEFATLPAPNPEVLVSLSFSPKGRWLAAGTQSGSIQVWDLDSIRRQLAAIALDWKLKSEEPAAGK